MSILPSAMQKIKVMKAKKRITTSQPKYMPDWRNVGTQLSFGGKWLRELGFEPGERLEIIHEGNKLIIKPIKEA